MKWTRSEEEIYRIELAREGDRRIFIDTQFDMYTLQQFYVLHVIYPHSAFDQETASKNLAYLKKLGLEYNNGDK